MGEKQWEIRGHSGRQGGGHRQTGTHSGRDSVGDKGDTVGGTERERHSGRHKGRHSGKQCSKVPGIYTSSQTGRQMNWRHPDSRTPPPGKSQTLLKKELRTPTVNCLGKIPLTIEMPVVQKSAWCQITMAPRLGKVAVGKVACSKPFVSAKFSEAAKT